MMPRITKLRGFTITFLHDCHKCCGFVAQEPERAQFPPENKHLYKSNSITKKKHTSIWSKGNCKVRNLLNGRLFERSKIQLKQALKNGTRFKSSIHEKPSRKDKKSHVSSKALSCYKLLNIDEKEVNGVSENLEVWYENFPTDAPALQLDSHFEQSLKSERNNKIKHEREAHNMHKARILQTKSRKKKIHFHANPQSFHKLVVKNKKSPNFNSKNPYELSRNVECKEDQSVQMDKKLKSPSPDKKRKTPKSNDEKIPKKGTLKRKRWCFRKLKQCNENQEDDLYADQNLSNFINLIEDDSDSECLDIATPKGTISMSPKDGSQTPEYEDCYNPEELDDLRKEAENYAYRQKKRKKSLLKDKKYQKEKTEIEKPIKEVDINRTLDQVCKVLFDICPPPDKTNDEDHFFEELCV